MQFILAIFFEIHISEIFNVGVKTKSALGPKALICADIFEDYNFL